MLLLTCKPMVSLRPPKVKIVGLGKLVFQSLGGTLMSLYTLKNFTKPCHFTDKAMAPHSSTLAWKIPWMEEPGRLQSMGWLRVGKDWATSLSLFTFMHWRRKWKPTPVFLPGECQGREPGGLPSMGSHRVGHDWSDLAAAAAAASVCDV